MAGVQNWLSWVFLWDFWSLSQCWISLTLQFLWWGWMCLFFCWSCPPSSTPEHQVKLQLLITGVCLLLDVVLLEKSQDKPFFACGSRFICRKYLCISSTRTRSTGCPLQQQLLYSNIKMVNHPFRFSAQIRMSTSSTLPLNCKGVIISSKWP